MKNFEELVDEYVHLIIDLPEVKKYLLDHTWISGSSTEVSPITVCQHDIEIQWDNDKEPTKLIEELEEIGKKMNIVKYVGFSKTDGSCPSYIYIELTQARY